MAYFEPFEKQGLLDTNSSYQCYYRSNSLPLSQPFVTSATHVQSNLELLAVNSGRLIVELESCPIILNPGDVIVINPYEVHTCFIAPSFRAVMYYGIILDMSAFSAMLPPPERELLAAISSGKRRFRSFIARGESDELFRLLERHYQSYAGARLCRLAGATFELLCELLESFVEPESHEGVRNVEFISAIDELIRTSFTSSLTTAEAASRLGYSESYFCRLFKASFGTSFMSFLVSYRLRRAWEMKGCKRSIVSIASEVGFNDYSYFARAFKHQYNISPSDYFGTNE